MNKESISFSDGKYSGTGEKLQPFKVKMLELANADGQGRILDIGCGSGIISARLADAGWDVFGIDISQKGVQHYRRRGFSGIVSDAERDLPFKDGVFDAVWASEVIEHLVSYRNLIKEIRRVLKKGGKLYITAPNSAFYGHRILYLLGKCPTELHHPYHLRFFSLQYLSAALTESGFEITRCMGQNVYFMLPRSFVNRAERLNRRITHVLLGLLGIRKVEGLIRGDKYFLYGFSSFLPSFFSSAIMLVATRAD